jgi:hypothetical protein
LVTVCGKEALKDFVLAQVKDDETKGDVSKAQLWGMGQHTHPLHSIRFTERN